MKADKESRTCKEKLTLFCIRRHRSFITTKCSIIAFFVIGIIYLAAGVVFIIVTNNLFEVAVRYDDVCQNQTKNCIISLNITKPLNGNIIFLYRLSNFYQNHRRIFKSKDDKQLQGQYLLYKDLSNCDPQISVNGSSDPANLYLPCGSLSLSFFNDTYRFVDPNLSEKFSDLNISLEPERDDLYKPLSAAYTTGIRWLEAITPKGTTDEHFIVWMRVAAMPNFLKTYSRCIDCAIEPGIIQVAVDMNYPNSMYSGSREIILCTTSSLGGKSYFISVTYLVVGGLSLIFALVFLIALLACPKKHIVGEIFFEPVQDITTIDQKLAQTLPRQYGSVKSEECPVLLVSDNELSSGTSYESESEKSSKLQDQKTEQQSKADSTDSKNNVKLPSRANSKKASNRVENQKSVDKQNASKTDNRQSSPKKTNNRQSSPKKAANRQNSPKKTANRQSSPKKTANRQNSPKKTDNKQTTIKTTDNKLTNKKADSKVEDTKIKDTPKYDNKTDNNKTDDKLKHEIKADDKLKHESKTDNKLKQESKADDKDDGVNININININEIPKNKNVLSKTQKRTTSQRSLSPARQAGNVNRRAKSPANFRRKKSPVGKSPQKPNYRKF